MFLFFFFFSLFLGLPLALRFCSRYADLRHFQFYPQVAVQEESKSITDLIATKHDGTDRIEAAVRHEAKEIRDQLREIKQSIDTRASSSAANQLSRGKFLKTTLLCLLTFTMQIFVDPCIL